MSNSKGFPNLARGFDVKDQAVIDNVTSICESELTAAGIEFTRIRGLFSGEVPNDSIGHLPCGWGFQRAWYYWVCKGPGLPIEDAEKLHEKFGTVVRVAGDCTSPHPREYYKGFGVGAYHVDSPEGLKALADTLKAVVERNK